MNDSMFPLTRFALGRFFVLVGLMVMPPGRVRNELTKLFLMWSAYVHAEIVKSRANPRESA